MYGREGYLNDLKPVIDTVVYNNEKPKPHELELHIQQPIDKKPIQVSGYTCVTELTRKFIRKSFGYALKILPGVQNDEVVLLETFMVDEKFKIVMVKPLEMIINMDIEYLRYVP